MRGEGQRRANIELKARCPDHERVAEACLSLGAKLESVETQTDTYFSLGSYRMKLRESSLGNHWLIWYSRPNGLNSRKSTYRKLPVKDPGEKCRILSQAMGVKVSVRKERTLYLMGPVRVHLDTVDGLGDFLEIEVVITDDLTDEDGHEAVADLQARFGIRDEDLVAGSYSDLVVAPDPVLP